MRCRLNQILISRRVDAGEPLPLRLQSHVDECSRCREHFEEQRRVAVILNASTTNLPHTTPPFLHAGIMAAVRRETKETVRLWPRWAVAFGVMLVAGFAVWIGFNSPRSSNQRSARVVAANPPEPFGEAFPALPSANLASLGQRLDQPFAEEANALMADARAALQLLAQNFVPAARVPGAEQ